MAEHTLINWCKRYNAGEDIEPKNCSRYCRSCGSVLAVYAMIIYWAGLITTEIAPLSMIAAFSAGYEIFRFINESSSRLASILFIPPRLLQGVICLPPTQSQLDAGMCLIKVFENSQYGKEETDTDK